MSRTIPPTSTSITAPAERSFTEAEMKLAFIAGQNLADYWGFGQPGDVKPAEFDELIASLEKESR